MERGELSEVGPEAVEWLEALDPGAFGGYAPSNYEAETWVLHAMWEDPDEPAQPATVDERWRAENPAADPVGILAYETAPFGELPPASWTRLRWSELADRLDAPLSGGTEKGYAIPPCFRWFPIRSWPESIWTPCEGSLDAVTAAILLDLLAAHSDGGLEARCWAFYDILSSPRHPEQLVLAGPLRAVFDAARNSPAGATPDNVWPEDRSWLLWSDYDLWGTRVVGDRGLIDEIDAHPDLETIAFSYHHAPKRSPHP